MPFFTANVFLGGSTIHIDMAIYWCTNKYHDMRLYFGNIDISKVGSKTIGDCSITVYNSDLNLRDTIESLSITSAISAALCEAIQIHVYKCCCYGLNILIQVF